jgi:phosphopantetheine adenylyltransferase
MRTCVYPEVFDHLPSDTIDVLERAVAMFDRVYVSVLNNSASTQLFGF